MNAMQSQSRGARPMPSLEFSALGSQLTQLSARVTDELNRITSKESELGEVFGRKIEEWKEAQKHLERLEEAHEAHTENTHNLSDDLECVSEELSRAKMKMDKTASSATDATPLVEVRSAIQRLKKENKEMDVRIGILDYELNRARTLEANPQGHSPLNLDESDDDLSLEG